MEGLSLSSIINYIDQYSTQISMLLMCLLFAVVAVFIWLWLYNKKKYNNLKHQIPANVVKNYLDSIIQNSTALKSSLFRGAGLDSDTSSLPSVMPLADLPGGSQVSVDTSDTTELKALISSLENKLQEKTQITTQLENENAGLKGEVTTKEHTIDDLEAIIESLRNASSDDSDETDSAAIAELESEVSSLKEQLQEYEVISADIANMKRLKEENAQLKESLKALEDGQNDDVDVSDEIDEIGADEFSDSSSSEDSEDIASKKPQEDGDFKLSEETKEEEEEVVAEEAQEVEEEPQPEAEEIEENKKSPEDLLSEFEKMLG